MDIQSLPKDVRNHIRSGSCINNTTGCVLELSNLDNSKLKGAEKKFELHIMFPQREEILNSLDAKSTAIAVRINLSTFRIQVVDNGIGITKSNMNFIGIRYMTSKCQTLKDLNKIKTFGFRGEALSNISKVSETITIFSRPANVENTYSKHFRNKKWSSITLIKHRPSPGTTVTVENFMYNLPVRQKRINKTIDIDLIKRSLEGLAIIHPKVFFSLRDDIAGKTIMQSKQSSTVTEALCSIYPNVVLDDFMEIKVSKTKISISGLISKRLSKSIKFQLLYLNKRPIDSSEIQKLINQLFSKNINFQACHGEHPAYILNISCPYSKVDLTINQSKKSVEFKNWNVVLKCVEKAVATVFQQEFDTMDDINVDNFKKPKSVKSQFGISQVNGIKGTSFKRKVAGNINIESLHSKNKSKQLTMDINNKKRKIVDNTESINNIYSQSEIHTKRYPRMADDPLELKSNDTRLFKTNKSNNREEKNQNTNNNKVKNNKHSNTQSLVLNSEFHACNTPVDSLLNPSVNTSIIQDEKTGKDLIMDMFLKSTTIYGKEQSEIAKDTMQSVLVNANKAKLNANTTMTMSLKIVSKKTICSNSIYVKNGARVKEKSTKSITHHLNKTNNIKTKEKKMFSKCVQTTVIREKQAINLNFNCAEQIQSKENFNVTLSKYFKNPRKNNLVGTKQPVCCYGPNYYTIHPKFRKNHRNDKNALNRAKRYDFNSYRQFIDETNSCRNSNFMNYLHNLTFAPDKTISFCPGYNLKNYGFHQIRTNMYTNSNTYGNINKSRNRQISDVTFTIRPTYESNIECSNFSFHVKNKAPYESELCNYRQNTDNEIRANKEIIHYSPYFKKPLHPVKTRNRPANEKPVINKVAADNDTNISPYFNSNIIAKNVPNRYKKFGSRYHGRDQNRNLQTDEFNNYHECGKQMIQTKPIQVFHKNYFTIPENHQEPCNPLNFWQNMQMSSNQNQNIYTNNLTDDIMSTKYQLKTTNKASSNFTDVEAHKNREEINFEPCFRQIQYCNEPAITKNIYQNPQLHKPLKNYSNNTQRYYLQDKSGRQKNKNENPKGCKNQNFKFTMLQQNDVPVRKRELNRKSERPFFSEKQSDRWNFVREERDHDFNFKSHKTKQYFQNNHFEHLSDDRRQKDVIINNHKGKNDPYFRDPEPRNVRIQSNVHRQNDVNRLPIEICHNKNVYTEEGNNEEMRIVNSYGKNTNKLKRHFDTFPEINKHRDQTNRLNQKLDHAQRTEIEIKQKQPSTLSFEQCDQNILTEKNSRWFFDHFPMQTNIYQNVLTDDNDRNSKQKSNKYRQNSLQIKLKRRDRQINYLNEFNDEVVQPYESLRETPIEPQQHQCPNNEFQILPKEMENRFNWTRNGKNSCARSFLKSDKSVQNYNLLPLNADKNKSKPTRYDWPKNVDTDNVFATDPGSDNLLNLQFEHEPSSPCINLISPNEVKVDFPAANHCENEPVQINMNSSANLNRSLSICSQNFKPDLCSTRIDLSRDNFEKDDLEQDRDVDVAFNIVNTTESNFNELFISNFRQSQTKNNCNFNFINENERDSVRVVKKSTLFTNNVIAKDSPNNENETLANVESHSLKDEWTPKINKFGNTFYINKRTGDV